MKLNLSVIKTLCNQKNITLKEFCKQIGVTDTGLSHAIRNNRTTSDFLEKAANYFGVSVGVFFGEKALPEKIERLISMFKDRFDFFDATFCFVIKQFTDFTDKTLLKEFAKAKKNHNIKDKYGFLEWLNNSHKLGFNLDIPPSATQSEHGNCINTFLTMLQNVWKLEKDDAITLRENSIISKDLCVLLVYWIQSKYSLSSMLQKYEFYLATKAIENIN